MNINKLMLSLNKNEAAVIISPENRRYFTEFNASDGVLAVTKNEAVFYTDSRYIEDAANKIKCCKVLEGKNQFEQLDILFKSNGINTVLTENTKITVSQFNNLKNNESMSTYSFSSDCSLDNLINSLRRKKDETELAKIKKAQSVAEKAYDYILGFVSPGQTEKEIQLALDYYMLSNGAEALSFETIALSGKNTSKPHGVPSVKKVENGDFITLDFGAVVDEYHSDMTRTFAVGYADSEMKKIYNTVLSAQTELINKVKAGMTCSDADKTVRDIISDAGYGSYFGHSTGHGVGIEIHEYPNVSPRSKEFLQPGDIITDEPGIYIPGKFGVRIEDMLYITETGCENLTSSPKNLIII